MPSFIDCTRCRKRLPAEAMFCTRCGAAVQSVPFAIRATLPPPLPPLPPPQPQLQPQPAPATRRTNQPSAAVVVVFGAALLLALLGMLGVLAFVTTSPQASSPATITPAPPVARSVSAPVPMTPPRPVTTWSNPNPNPNPWTVVQAPSGWHVNQQGYLVDAQGNRVGGNLVQPVPTRAQPPQGYAPQGNAPQGYTPPTPSPLSPTQSSRRP